jgi:hypothetical protein
MIITFRIEIILFLFVTILNWLGQQNPSLSSSGNLQINLPTPSTITSQQIDSTLYQLKMKHLANGDKSGRWPAKSIYPDEGAILPYNRIVAYYGNFYSKNMGVLGQYPQSVMLEKLKAVCTEWEMADSMTPVVPAVHYIVVTAQQSPGLGGKYRLRMPAKQIEKAIKLAKEINGIVFLDIQVGWSTLEEEIPAIKKYLLLAQVHLGIDPEFSMKNGKVPGTAIGTFDAADINYASEYLAALVKENKLPPKMLVIHRFTNKMLTNYKEIKLLKEVQVVINMDGFGFPAKKKNTYYHCVYKEPVQFAGIKLFYKNDIKEVKQLMTPVEILKLKPQPIYIQ